MEADDGAIGPEGRVPLSYEIDAQQALVLVIATGVVADEDLDQMNHRLLADPGLDGCTRLLEDWRAVERNDLTVQALQRAAEAWAPRDPHLKGVRMATVAPGALEYGLARVYQAYRTGTPVEMRIFREVRQAEDWLDLPPGTVASRSGAGSAD